MSDRSVVHNLLQFTDLNHTLTQNVLGRQRARELRRGPLDDTDRRLLVDAPPVVGVAHTEGVRPVPDGAESAIDTRVSVSEGVGTALAAAGTQVEAPLSRPLTGPGRHRGLPRLTDVENVCAKGEPRLLRDRINTTRD